MTDAARTPRTPPVVHDHDRRPLVLLLALLVFVALLLDVVADGWLSTEADPAVRDAVGLDGGLLYQVAYVVTLLGYSLVLLALAAVGAIILYRRGSVEDAWIMGIASVVSIGLVRLIKWLVGRARPMEPGTWDAFPSGHAANSVVVFGLLFFLVVPWSPRDPNARGPDMRPVAATAAAAFLGGASRLLLDVHWFTDVVAGWTFGLAVLVAALWWRRAAHTAPQM